MDVEILPTETPVVMALHHVVWCIDILPDLVWVEAPVFKIRSEPAHLRGKRLTVPS